MSDDLEILVRINLEKMIKSIDLVIASLDSIKPYDLDKSYSASESEPYDALSDRFSRAVEVAIKFFRSYEKYNFGDTSNTTRDLLNRMEKVNMISSVSLWLRMRDVRNRIVHDYLTEDIKEIYDLMMDEYGNEFRKLRQYSISLIF